MSKMRNPFIDPQPGDVVELMPGWTRTVTGRVHDSVVFEALYDGDRSEFERPVEVWQRASDLSTTRVIRRGEGA
jgi:hypothetical protein